MSPKFSNNPVGPANTEVYWVVPGYNINKLQISALSVKFYYFYDKKVLLYMIRRGKAVEKHKSTTECDKKSARREKFVIAVMSCLKTPF